nr:hypothetical protein [Pseudoroseomonas rhizosphaerae]
MSHEARQLHLRYPARPHLRRHGVAHRVGGHVHAEARGVAYSLEGSGDLLHRLAPPSHQRAGTDGLDPGAEEVRHGQDRPALLRLDPARRVQVDRPALQVALEPTKLKHGFRPAHGADHQQQEHANVIRHILRPQPRQLLDTENPLPPLPFRQAQEGHLPVKLAVLPGPGHGGLAGTHHALDGPRGVPLCQLGHGRLLRLQVQLRHGDALRQRLQEGPQVAALDAGANRVPGVLVEVAGKDGRQGQVARMLNPERDIQRDPLGERELGLLKIVSAERCAARLSRLGIKPGAAPLRAVGAAGEPVIPNAAELIRSAFAQGATSFAVM